MLVEDDNNLREIYEARLLAEGYEIVSASDGEEALALAVKEKPDLIISDVMMPKISGFDMLDILRSTPETKDTKVIMMTALSQTEDKTRADKLGADKYLVKSQVTLEDVAKVAREVLTGETSDQPSEPTNIPTPQPAPTDTQTSALNPTPIAKTSPEPVDPITALNPTISTSADNPVEPKNIPIDSTTPNPRDTSTAQSIPIQQTTTPSDNNLSTTLPTIQSSDNKSEDIAEALNKVLEKQATTNSNTSNDAPSQHKKVIEPINDPSTSKVDLAALLAKEDARQTVIDAAKTAESGHAEVVAVPDAMAPPEEQSKSEDKIELQTPPPPGDIVSPNQDPNNIAL